MCRADGRWSPDPATLVCICKIIKASGGWVGGGRGGGGGGEREVRHNFFPASKAIPTVFYNVCHSIESSKSLMIQLRGLILSVITSFSHSHYGSTPDCNIRSLDSLSA